MSETPLTLLPRSEVERRTSLSTTQLYRLIHRGDFPPPVKLGARSVAWPESQVNDWIAECIRRGRAA